MEVPFFTSCYQEQRYGDEIRNAINSVIKSGMFVLGEQVGLLERAIEEYTGASHAVGVASGSDALFLALQALDLPENSEVITTPFTFYASVSCIVRNNLKPVFVDVDNTYNIDVLKIEEAVTENTSCILPVDLFSHTPDYDIIRGIADKHDLKILEDSAEAFGMKWHDTSAARLGDAGVFSFFPTKTLGAFGDGGMVITDNEDIARRVRSLRVHGSSKRYYHHEIGINSRLDAIQAAILNVKLTYIDNEIKERAHIVEHYIQELSHMDEVIPPVIHAGAHPVWYVFTIRCKRRDELAAFLKEKGIGTQIYYPVPMHFQECFNYLGYKEGDFPVAEHLSKEVLALPVFIGMSDRMIDYVTRSIKEFYKG